MKLFTRKPSIKKSLTSKFISAPKRRVKKALIPGYGRKGTGILKDPKKALYNKAYNATTIDSRKLIKPSDHKEKTITTSPSSSISYQSKVKNKAKELKKKIINPISVKEIQNKRINKNTGYSMASTTSIDKALMDYSNSLYQGTNNSWEGSIVAYTRPKFNLGTLYYKLGEYDKAEREWFSLICLYIPAIQKLSILYRKEKRYKDIVLIIKENISSSTPLKVFSSAKLTEKDLTKAIENYEKHKNSDKSILQSEDFKELKRK